ncbi:MAG: AAA family ATPase [Acidobacteria bacterium]|nr:AAA family ATPase [Acidobacteriota bacterium]MYH34865.1 AAA family ATPase [Gammaproteobacteria bacterium]
MNRQNLTHYGLKWNPFATDLPVEGLLATPAVDAFCHRIEHHLVRQGGFALVVGEPGTGKSVALRLLTSRIEKAEGLDVAVLAHPSSSIGDLYREMGDVFSVGMSHNNIWAGFKALRERWLKHLEDTRMRPVLFVDEAQEMAAKVLTEMRLLSSTEFDSRAILSVVLAGDNRLLAKLRSAELQPVASRIRQRLVMTRAEPEELARLLDHLLDAAGNPGLMTSGLKETLVSHAAGNPRALTIIADSLLAAGVEQGRDVLDEKLYLEFWGEQAQPKASR